jgi:AP-1-like transcription factor
MNMEIEQYKKKLSVLTSQPRSASGSSRHPVFGSAAIQNINDVNFQFEFPKFGMFPGPTPTPMGATKPVSPYPSPPSGASPSSQASPAETSKASSTANNSKSQQSKERKGKDASMSSTKFSDLLSNSYPFDGNSGSSASRTSMDSAQFSVNGANTGSPSSSSNSVMGPSSSCGTSPEPFTQSPLGFKPLETLTTIGEEQSGLTSDINNSGQWICTSQVSWSPPTNIFKRF